MILVVSKGAALEALRLMQDEDQAKLDRVHLAPMSRGTAVDTDLVSRAYLEALVAVRDLPDRHKREVTQFLMHGEDAEGNAIKEGAEEEKPTPQSAKNYVPLDPWTQEITGLTQLIGALSEALKEQDKVPVFGLRRGERLYPVALEANLRKTRQTTYVEVIRRWSQRCDGRDGMGDSFQVPRSFFRNQAGTNRTGKLAPIMKRFGLEPWTTEHQEEYQQAMSDALEKASQSGKQQLLRGFAHFMGQQRSYNEFQIGTDLSPDKVVIEPRLEDMTSVHYSEEMPWPLLRVFSLTYKSYGLVDVRDLREYEYQRDAITWLELNDDHRQVLERVFQTDTKNMFGDVIKGKHGGMVVLAHGPTGVGKTLTAEAYAEYVEKPLYLVGLGEMGTSLTQFEDRLSLVLKRSQHWEAVLLFDEAEIFLAERSYDLERSSIVGIFLRLLDYYSGIMFLTSNREEVIDAAVKSRVTLRLQFPELTTERRTIIWRRLFTTAGYQVSEDELAIIASLNLNGRQIRNMVRLTKVVYPDSQVITAAEVKRLYETQSSDATGKIGFREVTRK